MGADAEGKAHEGEDEGRHRQREALVELHAVRREDLPLPLQVVGGGEERAERELALGLVVPGRAGERGVHRQGHVVEGEGGVAEAARVVDVGLVDGAVDEA